MGCLTVGKAFSVRILEIHPVFSVIGFMTFEKLPNLVNFASPLRGLS